jgi:hypothetical protein
MTAALVFPVLLVTTSATQPPAAVPTFEEALLAAETSSGSPGGEAYQREFGKKSSKHLGAALDHCLGGPVATLASFQVLLKVEADGRVSSALVRPEGRVSACVRDRLKRRNFPKPPAGGTWRLVNVRLNP